MVLRLVDRPLLGFFAFWILVAGHWVELTGDIGLRKAYAALRGWFLAHADPYDHPVT